MYKVYYVKNGVVSVKEYEKYNDAVIEFRKQRNAIRRHFKHVLCKEEKDTGDFKCQGLQYPYANEQTYILSM